MKGLGYLVSTLSVLLLGIVAWPKPDQPHWKFVALGCGMAASICGMLLNSSHTEKSGPPFAMLQRKRRRRTTSKLG